MNTLLRAAYVAAGKAASLAATVAPSGSENKVLRSLSARRGLPGRFREFAAARDDARKLVWFHAPSVGEGLQARPVIEWIRQHRPELQLAYTWYSPSAASLGSSLPVDFADYMPFDEPRGIDIALRALRPGVIAFTKLDVWPLLTIEAASRGTRVTLISGTVSSASSRLGSFATAFTSSAYRALHRAGAVSAEDAGNLVRLGVRREAVTVTGDTRYDQVWARAGASGNAALVERLRSDRPTLVAGSTWPPDERVLLDAWLQLRRERPMARLVIAPHEPSRRHVSPIVDWAVSHSLGVSLLSEVDHAPASGLTDVVIVDRTGVLGDLYELAHVAYVGGGFHDHGLHSVLEPAAFGAPVIFGPQHRSSRDAALLLEAGGGASVQDAAELRDTIWRWFNEAGQRQLAGAAARELVRQGLGATERSASLVLGELV